jgi:hypothetical protein
LPVISNNLQKSNRTFHCFEEKNGQSMNDLKKEFFSSSLVKSFEQNRAL